MVKDRADRARQVAEEHGPARAGAHAAVGGPIRCAQAGTGSWDLNVSATKLRAAPMR